MTESYAIRPATHIDRTQILSLLPQLADFAVPDHRDPDDLWQGDAQLLDDILTTRTTDSFAHVASTANGTVHGFVIVTMRKEIMSRSASAHLEAIVVHPDARGAGLGKRLLTHTETEARNRGARSLTLHVFNANKRALTLYEKNGFDTELIRAIKWLD